MNKFGQFFIAALIFSAGLFTAQNAAAAGTLVLTGDGTVYLVEGGMRRGFPTLSIFHSHGHKLSNVQPASVEDLALPVGAVMSYAEASLVLAPDGTVYQIENGAKRGFTSAQAFIERGHQFSQVLSDQGGLLNSIPAGQNIDSLSQAATPPPPAAATREVIKVLSPNGGEKLLIGSRHIIKWQQETAVNAVSIYYRRCESCPQNTIVTNLAVPQNVTEGSYVWDVPTSLPLAADYWLEITGYIIGAEEASDKSDRPFTIDAAGSGTLKAVMASGTPPASTFVSGAKNVEFARVVLAADKGNVSLESLAVAADGSAEVIEKIHLYHGETLLGSSMGTGEVIITPLVLPNAASYAIVVRADLVAGKSGKVRLGLIVKGTPLLGNEMQVVRTGTLNVGLDNSTPGARNVGGGRRIVATVFKLTAVGEDIDLRSLALEVQASDTRIVKKVTVWDGATQVGELPGNQSGIVTFSEPVVIPMAGGRVLTVKVDLAEVDGQAVKIGNDAAIHHYFSRGGETQGIGRTSGANIASYERFAPGYLITLVNNFDYFRLGDANLDGLVLADDAALVDEHVAGRETLTGKARDLADVDGDGKISSTDSALISRYVSRELAAFPRVLGANTTASNQPPGVPTVNGFQDLVYQDFVQTIWGFSFDPDEDPVSYEVWWGDGTKFFSPILPYRYAFFAQHSWAERGQYQIVVKAADGKGGFGVTSFNIWVR